MALSDSVAKLKETSFSMIEDVGSDIIVRREISTFNPIDTSTTNEIHDYPIKADIASFTSDEIKGLVQVGDVKVLISAKAVELATSLTTANLLTTIEENDKIVVGTAIYRVINPNPTIKANTIVIYESHASK